MDACAVTSPQKNLKYYRKFWEKHIILTQNLPETMLAKKLAEPVMQQEGFLRCQTPTSSIRLNDKE